MAAHNLRGTFDAAAIESPVPVGVNRSAGLEADRRISEMRRPRIVLDSIAVGLCLIAMLTPGNLNAKKEEQTITGTVQIAETSHGKVRTVYIKSASEGDVLVNRSTEVARELLDLVGTAIKATGYIKKPRMNPDFEQVIDVLSYEIIPPEEIVPAPAKTPQEDE